jgi:uncharacterized membrane protein
MPLCLGIEEDSDDGIVHFDRCRKIEYNTCMWFDHFRHTISTRLARAVPPPISAALRRVETWGDAALAALGGYAAAMAGWEMTHPAALAGFLLKNDLPLSARASLVLLLLAGMAAALLLWVLLAGRIARVQPSSNGTALRRAARWISLAILLPCLPILVIIGPGATPRALFTGTAIALAAAAWVVVRALVVQTAHTATQTAQPAAERKGVQSRSAPGTPALHVVRSGLLLTLALAAGYAVFMSVLTVARHNSFTTHAFDLGIHDQALYNILHSGYMRTTLYGPYAIDYIGDHFSPILYALAPFYALGSDARFLLVLQSVFLAAGAIPLYLLAVHKTRSTLLGCVLGASYLLYPALHGVNLDDFHQIALVCAFLMAALYFLETRRDTAFLIALALALLVKEEVGLSVIALGGYIFLAKRRYRFGALLASAGLIYFAGVVGWLMPLLGGKPQIDTRFGGFMAAGAQGAAGVVWTLFTNPVYTGLYILGNPDKVILLLQLFLPVLLLPLLAPGTAWLLALPALAVLMLTWTPAQYSINYHYPAHLIPFVYFLTVLGVARVLSLLHAGATAGASGTHRRDAGSSSSADSHVRRRLVITASLGGALLAASLAMSARYGHLIPRPGAEFPRPDHHDAVIASILTQIPAGSAVSTMSDIVPHLTTRPTVYLFPDVADAEYLLLDTDLSANFWPHTGLKARAQAIRDLLPHIQGGEFGLVRQEDGVLLLRRGQRPARTAEILRVALSARYEAEELPSDLNGTIVADAQASGGRARLATPAARRDDGKTGLIFGPYTDLPPGAYRVEFSLKVDRNDRAEPVAMLDVFTHKDGGVPRAAKEVLGTDFQAADRYQPFVLEFESDKPLEDLEFRVQVAQSGQGTLCLDTVWVTPIIPD